MYVCVFVCMYVCLYVCMYVCKYKKQIYTRVYVCMSVRGQIMRWRWPVRSPHLTSASTAAEHMGAAVAITTIGSPVSTSSHRCSRSAMLSLKHACTARSHSDAATCDSVGLGAGNTAGATGGDGSHHSCGSRAPVRHGKTGNNAHAHIHTHMHTQTHTHTHTSVNRHKQTQKRKYKHKLASTHY